MQLDSLIWAFEIFVPAVTWRCHFFLSDRLLDYRQMPTEILSSELQFASTFQLWFHYMLCVNTWITAIALEEVIEKCSKTSEADFSLFCQLEYGITSVPHLAIMQERFCTVQDWSWQGELSHVYLKICAATTALWWNICSFVWELPITICRKFVRQVRDDASSQCLFLSLQFRNITIHVEVDNNICRKYHGNLLVYLWIELIKLNYSSFMNAPTKALWSKHVGFLMI